MTHPDVTIAGAGIIGLTLALALTREGTSVRVLSDGLPMQQASSAAAGMLAVEDPHNPPQLLPLSRLSRSLYPDLLASLAAAGAPPVAWQTQRTLQELPSAQPGAQALDDAALRSLLPELATAAGGRFALLEETSLDPRELAAALVAVATHTPGLSLSTEERVLSVGESPDGVRVVTSAATSHTGRFVDCTGAWSLASQFITGLTVRPRKGQMLTVATPPSLDAHGLVLRTETIYLVPRRFGPRRGQCVIGATVEEAGFDRTTEPSALAQLLQGAACLLPALAGAVPLEQWAGLRPATTDLLPALGFAPGSDRLLVASGHYRNGILLAPGTAAVMTDLLLGRAPAVDLSAFAPSRFAAERPGSNSRGAASDAAHTRFGIRADV